MAASQNEHMTIRIDFQNLLTVYDWHSLDLRSVFMKLVTGYVKEGMHYKLLPFSVRFYVVLCL